VEVTPLRYLFKISNIWIITSVVIVQITELIVVYMTHLVYRPQTKIIPE